MFCIVSAVFNQLTGINAVNIYSSTIVAQSGFNVNLGVMLISLANVVGAFLAPFESKFVPVRKILIYGQFIMAVFLACVAIFSNINSTAVLIFIFMFILTYQLSIGSYYFVYVSQVTNETQNSVTVFALWFCVLIISLTTSLMIEKLHIVGTFSLFGASTVFGGLYFVYAMKSTQGLSSEQCKQLYYPDDLKNQIVT